MDDAGYEGESETEAADVLSDSDSEDESHLRGVESLSSDDTAGTHLRNPF